MTPEEQVKGFHEFMLGTLAKRQAEFSLVEAQLEKVVIAETARQMFIRAMTNMGESDDDDVSWSWLERHTWMEGGRDAMIEDLAKGSFQAAEIFHNAEKLWKEGKLESSAEPESGKTEPETP